MTYLKIIVGFLIWGILFWSVGGHWLNEKREDVCITEVNKENPDLAVVKRRCIETADYFMNEGYYGSSAWFYLLGGDIDKNINEVEAKIDNEFYMNIGHSYVLKGEFEKAKKIYQDYIWYENEYYDQSDDAMQGDFKILPRLYADKKENLEKGLALWNELYAPIGKIVTAYQNYERSEEDGNSTDAIKYLEETLAYSAEYKEKEVLDYWVRTETLAELYWNENEEKKAITQYQKIEKNYEKDEDKEYEYRNILLSIAKLYTDTSNHTQALLYQKKVLEHKEQSYFDDNASLAITYKDIGDVYIASKKPKNAITAYKKSIEFQHAYLKNSELESLNSALDELQGYYITLSNAYCALKDKKQALLTRQEYVTFLEEQYEGDFKPLAKAHHTMAEYFKEHDNTQEAIASQLLAIYDMQELVEREYEATAQENAVEILFDYYNDLEPYLVKKNDYNHTKAYVEMLGAMENLRVFQEDTFAQEENINHLILAKTYNRLHLTYAKVDDANNTKKYAQQALFQMRKAIENEEYDEIKERYADYLNAYYATLLRESYGEFSDDNVSEISEELSLIIDEYIRFQEEHYGEKFYLLSKGHETVAKFLKHRNIVKLAMEHYKKALTFSEKAFKEEESYENEQLLNDNIYALMRLYRDDYTNHDEAIRLSKELIELQKENYADKKIWLSSSYDALAQIYYKENNQSVEIVESYRTSIRIFKEEIIESNSTMYFYNLRESYVTLSEYYAKQKNKAQSIAIMQEMIDFTLSNFSHEQAQLARDYDALAEIYNLFEDNENVLTYKKRALLTIETLLNESNNYADYFYDFEIHYNALQRLYQKRNEHHNILQGIEKLKDMLPNELEIDHEISLLEMISYDYLRVKKYKKSLIYIAKANKLLDKRYNLECKDNIEQSYALAYIYLEETELKSLTKVCGSI